jgi:hypothetical protein
MTRKETAVIDVRLRDALAGLLAAIDERCGGRVSGLSALADAADRARELLCPTRREFYVVVAGQDADDEYLKRYPDMVSLGPIAWETYLNETNTFESATAHAHRLSKSHKWTRVGRLIVEDWPETEVSK